MKKNYWRIVSWVLLWVVFWVRGMWVLDPDFGWHVRMGEVFVKSGFPLTDPFSYTMAGYPMVANEWGVNVIERLVYERWGMAVLAGLYAGVTVGAMGLAIRGGKGRWWEVAMILVGLVWLRRGGVRAQVWDWLFLGLEVVILEDEKLWKKWRWLMPVGIGVWANMHGGFGVGILALLGAAGMRMWEKRTIDWRDWGVLVLAGLATGVNPYGAGLWREVGMTAADAGFFRTTVAEWQPWYMTAEMGFWILFATAVVFLWRYRRRFGWVSRGLFAGTWAMAVSGLRHGSLFGVVAGPVVTRGWRFVEDEFGGMGEKRLKWFYGLILAVVGVVGIVEGGLVAVETIGASEERFYPKKAVEWLRNNPGEGNLFSDYGWGGYLIWKLPGKKVFVDGRMAGWHWKAPNVSQADWVFKDYLDVAAGKAEFEPVFDKYGVTTVLWPRRDRRRSGWLWRLGWDKKKEEYMLNKDLEEKGWLKVYEDGTALVYRKL